MCHTIRAMLAAFCFFVSLTMVAADPLALPVTLPNGEAFASWEAPLQFSRTYRVNPQHPQAADENPGTEALPFRTINRAAQIMESGERVVIAAGVYRERVAPTRGGSGPDRMISYEAAPGADVILSGSRALATVWKRSEPNGQSGPAAVWMTTLQPEWFEAENPFAKSNLTDAQIDRCMPWAVPIKGRPTLARRRGLVFQDGRRLQQVDACTELAQVAGAYWVDRDGLTLHVRPWGNTDPNQVTFEVTTRGMIFAPRTFGLGYIRVQGLTIQHAGALDHEAAKPVPVTLPGAEGDNHMLEWLQACKGGPATWTGFDIGTRVAEVYLPVTLSLRLGRPIEWDSVNLQAQGVPEAEPLIRKTYRTKWLM